MATTPCSVKMCGITNPEDAAAAAAVGAQFVGMIMWPKSKRSVSIAVAKEIAQVTREHGATPVGVFVDEDAESILQACKAARLEVAQLHGDGARTAFPHLEASLKVIYVLNADRQGRVQTARPSGVADWLLVDGLQGGSGEAYDWGNLEAPLAGSSRNGWMLAGGLHPENVSRALAVVRPEVVDVSSGITGPDGVLKDRERMAAFMDAVRQSCYVGHHPSG